MDLITLEELQTSLGYEPDPGVDEATWVRHISNVSDFINSYCSESFSRTDDDKVRFQASWRGEILLPGGPVWDVTAVVDPRLPGQNDPLGDWDQMSMIFYLEPLGVYDVTYSHGHTDVPQEIKNLVYQACATLIDGDGPVTSFQVGDVQERYSTGLIVQLFGASAPLILSKYGGGDAPFTIDTSGSGQYPDYRDQGYTYYDPREE